MSITTANIVSKEIEAFQQETEHSVDLIIEGSDSHLDMILSLTKPLNELASRFEGINEKLFDSLSNFSQEEIQTLIMPRLLELNKTSLMLIGAIRTSLLYQDVRNALKNLQRSHQFLREMIHDLKHFRIDKDDEMDRLLNELNEL